MCFGAGKPLLYMERGQEGVKLEEPGGGSSSNGAHHIISPLILSLLGEKDGMFPRESIGSRKAYAEVKVKVSL